MFEDWLDMLNDVKDFFMFALPALLIAIIIFALIAGLVVWGVRSSCENTANMMGFDYHFDASTGCMINVNDQWIPLENYRIVE